MRIPFQINSNGKMLLGISHIANTQADTPIVVIMCYGLNGNRVEQHRMSVKLGEICEDNSINLIRFDYANLGLSEGDFFYSTISERVKNVVDIYDFLKGCFNKKTIVYLIGFSDGAKIAIQAKEYIEDFYGLICWNPIIKIPNVAKISNQASNRASKLKIHNEYRKPYKPLFGVCINLNMVKEIENDNSLEKINEKERNLFLFGENDRFTQHIRSYIGSMGLTRVNIGLIQGSGHLFNSVSHKNQVFENTIKWILGK